MQGLDHLLEVIFIAFGVTSKFETELEISPIRSSLSFLNFP